MTTERKPRQKPTPLFGVSMCLLPPTEDFSEDVSGMFAASRFLEDFGSPFFCKLLQSRPRARSSVRIERWSPEPKVRGSNPLGRIEKAASKWPFLFWFRTHHSYRSSPGGQEKIS